MLKYEHGGCFEHGLARIERMIFATGSQSYLGSKRSAFSVAKSDVNLFCFKGGLS